MYDNNFDVSVFIIDTENNYIELEEYIAYKYKNGMFVCLTNDELDLEYEFNNSICIYKDWREEFNRTKKELNDKYGVKYLDIEGEDYKWQNNYDVMIPNNERFDAVTFYSDETVRNAYLKQYLDGYLSCQNIMANVPSLLNEGETILKYIPAMMSTYYTKVKHNGKIYNGYLPAIGLLMHISKNIIMVNDALKVLKIKSERFKVHKYTKQFLGIWWSSSLYNESCAWDLDNGSPDYDNKNDYWLVLPLFAL